MIKHAVAGVKIMQRWRKQKIFGINGFKELKNTETHCSAKDKPQSNMTVNSYTINYAYLILLGLTF